MINGFLALSLARITSPTLLVEKGISMHNNSVMTGLLESKEFKSRMDDPAEEEVKEEENVVENTEHEEETKENPENENLAIEVMKMLAEASEEVKLLLREK